MISPKQQASVTKALRQLEQVRSEVAAEAPGGTRTVWFLDASGTLSLLVEPARTTEHDADDVVHDIRFPHSTAGDW